MYIFVCLTVFIQEFIYRNYTGNFPDDLEKREREKKKIIYLSLFSQYIMN